MIAGLALVGGLAGVGTSAEEATAEARFQDAWYLETGEGRLEEALKRFEALAATADVSRDLRAKALFRSGVCLRKLQRKEEARRAFERVSEDFPGVAEVIAAARRELVGDSEAEQAFRAGVERELENFLSKGNWDRGRDLVQMGPRALPLLFQAASSIEADRAPDGRDEIADRSAAAFVAFAARYDSARPLLRAALAQGEIEARERLLRLLGAESESQRLCECEFRWVDDLRGFLGDRDSRIRIAALESLASYKDAGLLPVLEAVFDDPDAEVRRVAVEAVAVTVDDEAAVRAYDPAATLARLHDRAGPVGAAAVRLLSGVEAWREEHEAGTLLPSGASQAPLVARLLELGRDPDLGVRGDVLYLLTRVEGVAVRDFLTESLRHEDTDVVLRALLVAGKRRDTEVANAVIALLGDERVRSARKKSAGRAGSPAGTVGKRAKSSQPRLARRTSAGWGRLVDGRVDEVAWSLLTNGLRGPLTLERLVDHLPHLDATSPNEERPRAKRGPGRRRRSGSVEFPKRVDYVFDRIYDDERRDLLVRSLDYYAALSAGGRARVLASVAYGLGVEGRAVVLAGLRDPSRTVRLGALEAAREQPDSEFLPAIQENLGHDNVQVRSAAVGALKALGSSQAVPALLPLLADPFVAGNAKNALLSTPHVELVPGLLEILRRQDLASPGYALEVLKKPASTENTVAIGETLAFLRVDVRAEAIDVLRELESPAAAPFLRPELVSEDPRVREAAVKALDRSSGDETTSDFAARLADSEGSVRTAAIQALARRTPERVRREPNVLPRLLDNLEDKSWLTRHAAVGLLARLEERRALPALVVAMRQGDSTPRDDSVPRGNRREMGTIAVAASKALGDFGDRSIVAPVLEALAIGTDKDFEAYLGLDLIRRHAAADDAPLLARSLPRQEPYVRQELLGILGTLEYPKVFDLVRGYLEYPVAETRRGAVRALAAIGDLRAVDLLIALLGRETDGSVNQEIIETLSVLADPRALSALLANVRDPVRGVRDGRGHFYALGDSLLRYPPEDVIRLAETLLAGEGFPNAKRNVLSIVANIDSPRVRKILVGQTQGADDRVRVSAIRLLGETRDRTVLPHLVELLRDRNGVVRDAARKAIDEIRYVLEQESFAQAEAGVSSDTAELRRLLDDPAPAVRAAAAASLGRLRARDSLSALVRRRKDPDPQVRTAVEAALDAISAE